MKKKAVRSGATPRTEACVATNEDEADEEAGLSLGGCADVTSVPSLKRGQGLRQQGSRIYE